MPHTINANILASTLYIIQQFGSKENFSKVKILIVVETFTFIVIDQCDILFMKANFIISSKLHTNKHICKYTTHMSRSRWSLKSYCIIVNDLSFKKFNVHVYQF